MAGATWDAPPPDFEATYNRRRDRFAARRTGVGPHEVILTADRITGDRTKVLCGGPGYCAACDGGQ